MDILRNLFGNVTSGIIRLAVAVGVLAAVYLFIVKPVMDTTNNAIDSANKSFEKSFHTPLDLKDVNKTIENASRQVQIQIHRSIEHTASSAKQQKLLHCVQASAGNTHKMRRCVVRFQP
jgi:hypothetical protein